MSNNFSQSNSLNARSILSFLIGILFLAGFVWVLILAITKLPLMFAGLNPALFTAAATVIAAAFTVTAGRYFERRKEIEAAYRDKKTVIYDQFLVELFRIFLESKVDQANANQEADPDMVKFLREHHRKLILWSGPQGLKAYSEWYRLLQTSPPSAQTVLKLEKFFLALRADLGHSNKGLKEGDILRFILNDTDLLLLAAKANPNISLEELAAIKNQLTEPNE